MRRDVRCGDERAAGLLGEQMSWCIGSRTHARTIPARRTQGGYIFYAGGSLAGAGYCRQSPAAGHLTTPTVAGLPGLCANLRPTTSKSSPI